MRAVTVGPSRGNGRLPHNAPMPNLAAALKSEIARMARRVVRAETQALRQAATTHRSEIAALKRRVKALEQALRQATRGGARAARAVEPEAAAPATALRFSAKGFASHRRRLGLSAADMGRLLGTSGQTIYLWESGKSRPRAGHLAGIAALRAMGKREAVTRLETLAGPR